ncbi:hypothetical protein O181_041791 [Austropuccinia psidii MF-1]|uniref:Uncharacterized protein n=1 Tax=Austropuccinia psidii MF-1 TaxID=1389203 RepID=A0A9Q3HEJ4_9BASI|nr:hypothetical protein [Austropuccinia psidii MF-1]
MLSSSSQSNLFNQPIICPLPRRTTLSSNQSIVNKSSHHHSLSSPTSARPSIVHHSEANAIFIQPHSNLAPDDFKFSLTTPQSSQDDDVLSEFLSLFAPASPTLISILPSQTRQFSSSSSKSSISLIPNLSFINQINPTSPHSKTPQKSSDSFDLNSPNTSHHLPIISSHLGGCITSSPISRCHNPLPRHGELDEFANRLIEPFNELSINFETSNQSSSEATNVDFPAQKLFSDKDANNLKNNHVHTKKIENLHDLNDFQLAGLDLNV